jgi:hypothetical protein
LSSSSLRARIGSQTLRRAGVDSLGYLGGNTRVETFAFFCGIVYFGAGLLGLVPQALMLSATDSPPVHITLFHGKLLGLFPVNVLHSAAHVAIGVWGILAGRSVTSPRFYARAMTVFFGALALMGVIPGLNTLFGMLPLHGNDVWLHGVTAAVAGYFGWHPAASVERRASVTPDRRRHGDPVPHDRRSGHGDRRLPGSEV